MVVVSTWLHGCDSTITYCDCRQFTNEQFFEFVMRLREDPLQSASTPVCCHINKSEESSFATNICLLNLHSLGDPGGGWLDDKTIDVAMQILQVRFWVCGTFIVPTSYTNIMYIAYIV